MKIVPAPPAFIPKEWAPPPPPPEPEHPALTEARRHFDGAWHASLAYHDQAALRKQWAGLPFEYFENQSFSGYGLILGDSAVLSFCGTRFSNRENVKADLALWPRGNPRRHGGFLRGWEALSGDINKWLECHRPTRLSIYGHSLGGAIALVAALELASRWGIEQVIVFGCPRVGGPGFGRLYAKAPAGPGAKTHLGAVTVRYMLGTDIVARIPPPIYFRHVGESRYLTKTGELIHYPLPFLVRALDTDNPAMPSVNEPFLVYFKGALLSMIRSVSPLFGYGILPLWLTVGWIVFVFGRLTTQDVLYHFSKRYVEALFMRQSLVERKPELSRLV